MRLRAGVDGWERSTAAATVPGAATARSNRNADVETAGVGNIEGVSPWADSIRQEILNVAIHQSSVLITGPTGTGKEMIARAIHCHSRRAEKPFVAVDCAAISGSLFVSHMFGHVKGAFTGASHAASGCFRAADGGTVLLDEIGELEPEFQAKLLRVLQQRTVTPVGSYEEIPVDVRIIAATNCDLETMVSAGRFREDLYYRLNVISLRTVALKDRPEDIEVLAKLFLTRKAARDGVLPKRLSRGCLEHMRLYEWPGNVRELENFMERVTLLITDREICPHAFHHIWGDRHIRARHVHGQSSPAPPLVVFPSPAPSPSTTAMDDLSGHCPTLADLEREHIRRTLERTNHNQTLAAGLLGISRKQLARKIRKYEIDSSHFHPGRPHK
jgi:DNA-binding NtrC family response regulator